MASEPETFIDICRSGSISKFNRYLLDHPSIDVNEPIDGVYPIEVALDTRSIVTRLINMGANVKDILPTAISKNVSRSVLSHLIDNGANVNMDSLIMAVKVYYTQSRIKSPDTDIIDCLLAYGTYNDSIYPFAYLSAFLADPHHPDFTVIRLLESKIKLVNIDVIDIIVYIACSYKYISLIKNLIGRVNINRITSSNFPQTYLGATLSVEYDGTSVPLLYDYRRTYEPHENSSIRGIVDFLLSQGIDLNAVNHYGYLPLTSITNRAIPVLHEQYVIRLLIDVGSNPFMVDKDGTNFFSKTDRHTKEYIKSKGQIYYDKMIKASSEYNMKILVRLNRSLTEQVKQLEKGLVDLPIVNRSLTNKISQLEQTISERDSELRFTRNDLDRIKSRYDTLMVDFSIIRDHLNNVNRDLTYVTRELIHTRDSLKRLSQHNMYDDQFAQCDALVAELDIENITSFGELMYHIITNRTFDIVSKRHNSMPKRDLQCTVCFGETALCQTKCSHIFCIVCLYRCNRTSPKCPCCRSDYDSTIYML